MLLLITYYIIQYLLVSYSCKCTRTHTQLLVMYSHSAITNLLVLVVMKMYSDPGLSQGFLMAEDLNGYFSSVFTKVDIRSLPVPDAKFQGAKPNYLGLLIVTSEMVAKKTKAMKGNTSPGVDGIPPRLLMETVKQISMPLARLFNLSLKEGVVPFEWKEANIIPLFKKGSRNKSDNYRPVSLTSVVCKLLERLIKDHMVDFLVRHKLLNPFEHGFLKARSCLTNMFCFFKKSLSR